jgi:hypothetical protein
VAHNGAAGERDQQKLAADAVKSTSTNYVENFSAKNRVEGGPLGQTK